MFEVEEISGVAKGKNYTVSVGEKINFLTITKLYNNRTCDCICECGNKVSGIRVYQLFSGNNKSCGCYNRRCTSERNFKHGDSKTRLYKIWIGMKKRCYNKNSARYPDYGGRGIIVCDEWHHWETFKNWSIKHGYTDTSSIERIDFNGNYEPSNCMWIPIEEQSKNRRNCHLITYDGKTMNLTDWAKEIGVKRACLASRIQRGWSEEKALATPVETNNK